jgi:two-component system osmolarity sensor histidine kinase EnvZ
MPFKKLRLFWKRIARYIARQMPRGLLGRSLLIILIPMVLLQSVIAFVFMERHWQTVTKRLSQAVTRDISAIISMVEDIPDIERETISAIARNDLNLRVSFLDEQDLPPPLPRPFFSILDQTLSNQIREQIGRPFWIDTVGQSNYVQIRIKLDNEILRVFARRSHTYASNSHIFLVWMIGTSIVLLAVAFAFLRNQIKPIQRLAEAAENFGKGRSVPKKFKPAGAREVRKASHAFQQMADRIERHVDQRTTMLAGVSHDLRTILTRFKLELALLSDDEFSQDLRKDVEEMQAMLEAYLSFAKGNDDEKATLTDFSECLEDVKKQAERLGYEISLSTNGDMHIQIKIAAMKRCLSNLVSNACRYADKVEIHAERNDHLMTIRVEDDGPGIPEDKRQDAFRPFLRLDDARNQDQGGTGLGLAIARDIARLHGGDIHLSDSALGGLKAEIKIPV